MLARLSKGNIKIILLLILALIIMLTLAACNGRISIDNLPSDSGTEYFHYEYGDSRWNHGEFWIWTENDSTYFEGLATGIDVPIDAFAEADAGVFDSILQVIHDNNIDLWNGFYKSDNQVSDGHGFSLDFKYGVESIRAHGYMFEPENYQSGHDALLAFLSAYAKTLPITAPPADSVGYFIIYAGEFRFDLMLDYYDGEYSRVGSVRITQKSDIHSENSYEFRRSVWAEAEPTGEREKYIEFDFKPAEQIREKSLMLALSNGWPDKSVMDYVVIEYDGNKIIGSHFCYAVLSTDEQNWFTDRILAIIGLPEDFDLSTLF